MLKIIRFISKIVIIVLIQANICLGASCVFTKDNSFQKTIAVRTTLSPQIQMGTESLQGIFIDYSMRNNNLNIDRSGQHIVLPDNAIPVPAEKLEDFFSKHDYFLDAYRHEYNPVYPQGGCGSFSMLAGEAMLQELLDIYVVYSGMSDHYYLSAAVVFASGIIDEFIIDYTADQIGYGQIAPLVGSRGFIKSRFPKAYDLYYSEKSKVMRPNEILQDNFTLAFIHIDELVDELKEKNRELKKMQEFLGTILIHEGLSIQQNFFIGNSV